MRFGLEVKFRDRAHPSQHHIFTFIFAVGRAAIGQVGDARQDGIELFFKLAQGLIELAGVSYVLVEGFQVVGAPPAVDLLQLGGIVAVLFSFPGVPDYVWRGESDSPIYQASAAEGLHFECFFARRRSGFLPVT